MTTTVGIIMASMNISLPNPMKAWVEQQICAGQYSNVSDYVRDLIRQDQNKKSQNSELVQALVDGENSGISHRSLDDIWQAVADTHKTKDTSINSGRNS